MTGYYGMDEAMYDNEYFPEELEDPYEMVMAPPDAYDDGEGEYTSQPRDDGLTQNMPPNRGHHEKTHESDEDISAFVDDLSVEGSGTGKQIARVLDTMLEQDQLYEYEFRAWRQEPQ